MDFIIVRCKVCVEEADELLLSVPLVELCLCLAGRLAPLASAPALPIGRVDIYVEILTAVIAFLSVNCSHVIPSDESSSMVGLLIFHTSP